MFGAVGLEGSRLIVSLVITQRHIHKRAEYEILTEHLRTGDSTWVPSLPVDPGLTPIVLIYRV